MLKKYLLEIKDFFKNNTDLVNGDKWVEKGQESIMRIKLNPESLEAIGYYGKQRVFNRYDSERDDYAMDVEDIMRRDLDGVKVGVDGNFIEISFQTLLRSES